ncbi:DNA polymerase/3'-5' exonuclease PolX [Sporocytophaga myxococcoides]|uniref:DNA polymerase/3'-5' exonuclease PolX n=1 Tax=Sporocytophaga myxococcoides TaxID=153721 RepID=UPI000413279C|nr:DNA polymerase/3'-5' exonuclease PolX [Sporocytophaga myxococcoides]
MYRVNKELAEIFESIGSIYEFKGPKERFRSIAYHNAARIINDLPEDIRDHIQDGKFIKTYGIGKSIEEKIFEFLKTNQVSLFNDLQKEVPKDFLTLMKVQGLGPETLKRFYYDLNLSTKEQIIEALQDGRILQLKGFQKKKVNNILSSLLKKTEAEQRLSLWDAQEISTSIIKMLNTIPQIQLIDIAGSLRRQKETVGDIDLLIAAKAKDRKAIIRHFVSLDEVENLYAEGDTKASVYFKSFKRQVDIRIVTEDQWGAALQYFTGSKAHNIHLRKLAIEKGYKINEYGLFTVEENKKIAGENEEDIYHALGLEWMPPEMREDTGEIELASEGLIPQLITMEDIKGDMHTHSKWSDGHSSIEEIADYISSNQKYDYIVITDHSKSQIIAGGMEEDKFIEQLKEIKKVNKKIGKDLIKSGTEVDILPDGSLDLSDSLLQTLDWVVASIHSHFNQDNTERIIKACHNPYVCAIGHPTGRVLGAREGYIVDMERILDVAAYTGTALEINAHSHRMDINDRWAKRAIEKGVKLVIGTDSHNTGNYSFMKLGVAIARRAWCTKDNILNTSDWAKIEVFKKRKLEKIYVLH